jgi:hypothetical protein
MRPQTPDPRPETILLVLVLVLEISKISEDEDEEDAFIVEFSDRILTAAPAPRPPSLPYPCSSV